MARCWDEYMWKAHKAIAMDPWVDHVQLLDVLIVEKKAGFREYLPSWLLPRRRSVLLGSAPLVRVGSMQSLALRKIISSEAVTGGSNKDEKSPSSEVNPDSSDAAIVKRTIDNPNVDEAAVDTRLWITVTSSDMPDIETTINSSNSLLGSFAVATSPTGQFDISGSKTISVNVTGVMSRRVDLDALLELVTARRSSLSSTSAVYPAAWKPDIFLPQLRWSSKRGQTLWIVVEIIYASSLNMQDEAKAGSNKAADVKAVAGATDVNVSVQGSLDNSYVWKVAAPEGKSVFPMAFRLQRLDYDASGNLVFGSSSRQISRCHSSRYP
ncbi:hypothetical protein KP509_17G010600 [Ceratopteris richardii]|uniref:Uncharacterized protein n=1 Tax=Ceratopteris richardii TaxID=49495 RepID=A0A8T2SS07_CERRI|nr:hypothetical protein KP509_17G010600 [Ceratopteris richardii]